MPAPKPENRELFFKAGQYVFQENDAAESLYLISSGTVSIRKKKDHGEVEIARIFSNEVLGEMAFFDRAPRSASAMAFTEVRLTEISYEALDAVFAKVPDYLRTIIAATAERLRKADETIRRLQKEIVSEGSPFEPQAEAAAGPELSSVLSQLEGVEPSKSDGKSGS